MRSTADSGVDTGGGDVAYDSVSDGFFLLRVYDQPPKKAGELMRELEETHGLQIILRENPLFHEEQFEISE